MAISPCLGEENQNGKTADPETGKRSALYSSRSLEQNVLPTLPHSTDWFHDKWHYRVLIGKSVIPVRFRCPFDWWIPNINGSIAI